MFPFSDDNDLLLVKETLPFQRVNVMITLPRQPAAVFSLVNFCTRRVRQMPRRILIALKQHGATGPNLRYVSQTLKTGVSVALVGWEIEVTLDPLTFVSLTGWVNIEATGERYGKEVSIGCLEGNRTRKLEPLSVLSYGRLGIHLELPDLH